MRTVYAPINFDRCLLGGLFTGLIASLVAIVFNVIYRGSTNLIAFAVVMPISIFTAFPFFNLVVGGVYFLFVHNLKKGARLFIVVFLLATVLSIVLTRYTGSRADHLVVEFKGLVIGLEVIEGVLGALLIPFLVNHPTLYLTDKDIRGEQ
ncbi:MAG TPA: hypothetical protein VGS79_12940 [Puia sp.]|nr:hypothetical protein [Puia sp.]